MERALILHTIQQDNILPLISNCNAKCLFCSHSGNPPSLKTLSVGIRTLVEVLQDIVFLDSKRNIIIGESATRIIEGEPFLYPHIAEVLRTVRETYPHTPINITTNGTLLNEEMVCLLAELGGVEINLSINAVSSSIHKKLMKNNLTDLQLDEGLWFHKYNIQFHGSLVAMPWFTGWEEIELTLRYLQKIGAVTVRIFMPGYSKYSPEELFFSKAFTEQLRLYVDEIKKSLSIPVLLEPPFLKSLSAEVAGVLPNSPAEKSGIQYGDTLLLVNGTKVNSRVDAWQSVTKLKNPKINLMRNGVEYEIIIEKKANQKSGLICEYDVDWLRVYKLLKYKGKSILTLTSELALPLISLIPVMLSLQHMKVRAVKNISFGGSIACAGLLTLMDIDAELGALINIPEQVLIPSEILDFRGYDLFGEHYSKLEDKYAIKIDII